MHRLQRNMKDLPEFYWTMSLRLSRALDDIGVNSWVVRRRRRTFLMLEVSRTIDEKQQGCDVTCFHFGSQSEGTTTPGLNSDIDNLLCLNDTNIMSSWSEWEPERRNYLMVKVESCSPQHYLLQEIRPDSPRPAINPSDMLRVVDRNDRVLLTKTHASTKVLSEGYKSHYHFRSESSKSIVEMYDYLYAYWCMSLPLECHKWFERPRPGHWPTPEMLRDVRKYGCFLVPKGYFESHQKCLEWRISPNLIERTLMFSMNTLKLKCYVVLKILKSHVINPFLNNNKGNLTSFHCKTALFFAAEVLPPAMWKEDRLMECIVYCLKLLLGWANTGMCPHYIVAGVNLFHGKITSRQLANLSKILSNIIDTHLIELAYIQADDLGNRIFPTTIRTVRYSEGCFISTNNSLCRWLSVHAHLTMNEYLLDILSLTSDLMPEQMSTFLGLYFQTVRTHSYGLPFPLREIFFRYTSKQIMSVLASTAASCCIRNGYNVPRNILSLFESSLHTDVASSRLKLASFLFCHNELERAADVLNDVERRYDDSVQAVCGCGNIDSFKKKDLKPLCTTSVVDNDDVFLTNNTALCVRYMRQEVFCAPPILRYEMVRGIGVDINHRDRNEQKWIKWAAVDALPYLYYLQYLTFRGLGLGQRIGRLQALINCFLDHSFYSQLFHRTTFYNLLGHCLEMERKPEEALQLYRASVEAKPRNNAAHWHIYRLNHGYEI